MTTVAPLIYMGYLGHTHVTRAKPHSLTTVLDMTKMVANFNRQTWSTFMCS